MMTEQPQDDVKDLTLVKDRHDQRQLYAEIMKLYDLALPQTKDLVRLSITKPLKDD
jgi:hypothetical protein